MGQIVSHWMLVDNCSPSANDLTVRKPVVGVNMDLGDGRKMEERSATMLEFHVNMTCESCAAAIRKSLADLTDIKSLQIDIASNTVLVETTQPSIVVQKRIETTGLLGVLKGIGPVGDNKPKLAAAAVAILKGEGSIYGLVRFLQVSDDVCSIEGSLDSVPPGRHALLVHAFGDFSDGYLSTGPVYDAEQTRSDAGNIVASTAEASSGVANVELGKYVRLAGDLGNICADESGHCTFQQQSRALKVRDIIGRSLVLHVGACEDARMGHAIAGMGLVYGIIARAAGLFENRKKICECSGKTLWEEREFVRDNPLKPIVQEEMD